MGLIPVGIPKAYFLQVYPKPTNNGVNPYVTAIVDSNIFKRIGRWISRMFLKLEEAPMSQEEMTFDEARMYILFCRHNGHKDWRLPTRHEWQVLHGYYTPVWLHESDNEKRDDLWHVQPIRDSK